MTRPPLTPDDWIKAGFRTIADAGPAALQIKKLAEALKATKGSFYWHFEDLAALKTAILERWETEAATAIFAVVMAEADPMRRLDALAKAAAKSAPEEFGGRRIEAAMRAWALSDPDVGAALTRIDRQRIEFLTELLRQAGFDNPRLPLLLYSAHIGLDDLTSRGFETRGSDLAMLLDLLTERF